MLSISRRIDEWKHNFRYIRRQEPNVFIFIVYGLLFDVVVNLWKPFSIKFLERLGGQSLEISLLNALPGLVAAVILMPGAVFIARFPKKRKVTAAFILISRGILLLIAFVPFLPAAARPMLFVVLLAIMNCPDALSQTSFQSFLGGVFNGHLRAQAITLRNKFGNAAVPLVTILTGLIITYLPATEEQRMLLYQLFFVGAFLIGMLEVFVFTRFREPEDPKNKTAPNNRAALPSINFSILKSILKDKTFGRYLWPVLLFTFFWQAGWPICGIYEVVNLRANELWLALISLASGAGAFATAGFWQKYIRKHGNSKALVFSAFLIAVNLSLFPLSPNVYVLTFLSLFSGFAVLGINSATLNGVLEATPDENRLVYLAFYNTIVNISLFFAPLFAHALLSRFGIYTTFIILIAGRTVTAGIIGLTQLKKHPPTAAA